MLITESTKTDATAEVIEMTPQMARDLLYRNQHNRPVAPGTVNRYLADMRAGNWAFTADPIRLDVNGSLLDGQHRLEAIAQLDEGATVRVLMVTGLAPEAQMFMDQGRRRQPGQQLALMGVKDSFVTAAGVRLLLIMDSGFAFKDYRHAESISTPAMLDWIRHNRELVESVGSIIGPVITNDARGSVALCAAYMFARTAPLEAVHDFFLALKSGADLAIDNPILLLRNRLHNIKNARVRMSQREMLGLIIEVWNAWRDGVKLEKLSFPRGGWTAENFPVVTTSAQ